METPRRRGRPRKNPLPEPVATPAADGGAAPAEAQQQSLFGVEFPVGQGDGQFGNMPIIEVTAQLVEALERGDKQARTYVEQLLSKYVELYGEAGAVNFQRAFDGVARSKRLRLPDSIPQQTAQEVRTLAVAISDGRTLHRWEEVIGEVALRHVIPDEPFQVKFVPGAALTSWTGADPDGNFLKEELIKFDLDAVLLFYETLGTAIAQLERGESLYVTLALDDLIYALGWDKAARRNSEERNRLRLRVWHWMMVFDGMKVLGQRNGRYRDPDTKQVLDLTSEDALIRVMGQRVTEDVRTPDGRPMPIEITFAAGPWIERFKGNRQILSEFGNVRVLARIPSGKAAGAWARCIGMTLYQRWREGASRAQIIDAENQIMRWKPFTRRALLTGLFRAQPDVMEILDGPNPMRAREYWDQAIQMLKTEGFIGEYREIDKLPSSRKGWQEPWLDQQLDISPGEEPLEAAEQILQSAQAFQSAVKKKRGRPRKGL